MATVSVLTCLHVHHFSIFYVHTDECTSDWYSSSFKQATTRLRYLACSSVLTFHAHNCRLLTVIARTRKQRLVNYERRLCTLLTLLTAGLTHGSTSSPCLVHRRRVALQRVHKHHLKACVRALSVCLCMRVEIEAMEDDSDVVIFRSIKLNLLSSTSVNIRTAKTVSRGKEKRTSPNRDSLFSITN